MKEQEVAASLAIIGYGFTALAKALNIEGANAATEMLVGMFDEEQPEPAAEPALHKAVKEQKAVNRARAGEPEPEPETEPEPKPVRKFAVAKPKPQAEDADDDKEGHTADGDDDAQARLDGLSDEALEDMGRNDLKELAEALGFQTAAKKGDELRDMLKQKRSGQRKAVAAPKAAKGKAAKYSEAELDEMRLELEIFFKANREMIETQFPHFFDKAKKGEEYDESDADHVKAALIFADEALTVKEHTENVGDAKANGTWDGMVEAAEAEV